jgi:hypothetical protein
VQPPSLLVLSALSQDQFKPRLVREARVEAILARQREEQNHLTTYITSERKTGPYVRRDELGLLRLMGQGGRQG